MIAFLPEPLEAGAARIETEEAALTAGLAGPDDVELLARVAYVSAIGRKPALPADACARAKSLAAASNDPDAVAYTCAQAALAAADGSAAAQLLAAIKEPKRWLDTELAQARAAKLVNDKAAMARFAQAAAKVDYERAQMANVASNDAKIVVQAAKQLLTGK
ncbi:MAG TPA: hypothetical protein VNO30_43310 [Kofleriaceae bacterium]|nr:hypothetical protein [Kofleriaceae bacterium]